LIISPNQGAARRFSIFAEYFNALFALTISGFHEDRKSDNLNALAPISPAVKFKPACA
jgi:hypothetical protein